MKFLKKIYCNFDANVAFLLGLTAGLPTVQFLGVSIFLYILYLYVALSVIRKKFQLSRCKTFIPLIVIVTISAALCWVQGKLPYGYQINNLKGFINLSVLFLFMGVIPGTEYTSEATTKGLVYAARLNVAWIIMQYLCWQALSLDINDLLFNQTLGFVEKASQYKQFGYIPTGLCWNIGGIAAIVILGVARDRSVAWKAMSIAAALLSQSMSLMLGTISLLGCQLYLNRFACVEHIKRYFKHGGIKVKFAIAAAIAVMVLGLIVVLPQLSSTFVAIWYRIEGALTGNFDSSTAAHLGYYTNIPEIIKCMTPYEIIFGFGANCSGYIYSMLTGQYSGITWIIESDYINTLLNFGVLGFISFYYWIVETLASFHDRHIKIAVGIILLLGLLYNLQSPSVIALEMLLCARDALPGSEHGLKFVEKSLSI